MIFKFTFIGYSSSFLYYFKPTNSFFIGEIVASYSEEQFLTNGAPDIKKVKPFLLTMPDNRYWSVGDNIGRAWSDGKSIRSGSNKDVEA